MPRLRSSLPNTFSLAFFAAVLGLFTRPSPAMEWFVNNRDGDNIFDGRSIVPVSGQTGPVRTIGAALKRVGPGDTVHVANVGIVYYESLQMIGPRFVGVTIEGNGAIVSGARPVPLNALRPLGNGLFVFTPRRKAWYQLISGERAVPEFPVDAAAAKLPEIPPDHWAGWRGSIYLRLAAGERLEQMALEFAGEEAGITLLDSRDVLIHGLELRHFRLDGVNAHDRCNNIFLDGVRLVENGRAGLATCGTSVVGLKDSVLEGNRLTQVLNTEMARTEILSSQLGPARSGPIRVEGGHVLEE